MNAYIKNMFTQGYMLKSIFVKGEVSNCKYHSSGHIYFTLKDSKGTMSCVMFAGSRAGLNFRLQEVDACKYDGHHCAEAQYPLELPSVIYDDADDCYEEGIPESCLTLSTHRRALKRDPEADYEAEENQGSKN